jgi:LPPG:FO 2-phospho-L-lactate transferase
MLAGGIGASRLAVPLARALGAAGGAGGAGGAAGAAQLTLVVNTADDVWLHGLRVCPDLDTNLYALAGIGDAARGWGVRGDTFAAMDQLRREGGDPWFALGDRDLATHLRRTDLLRAGATLSEVTAELAAQLGITARLLPMTDAEVATEIVTPGSTGGAATGNAASDDAASDGADGSVVLGFQEWFVRHRAEPAVRTVRWRGIEAAQPAPGVLEAIAEADLVVIAPSNPLASIEPILALPGVRAAVAARGAVAVTPVVSGVPITDEGEARRARSRAALLGVRGLPHTATAVATHYRDLLHTFVLDEHDADQAAAIEALGPAVALTPTLARPDSDPPNTAPPTDLARTDLARLLLTLARPAPDRRNPSRR